VKQNHRFFAPILLLASAFLWSLGGILIKSVEWNSLAVSGARSGIAFLVILAFCRKVPWRFSRLEIAGAIAYAATVILFVCATRLTTAANAIFLQYTAPIYVAVAGHWWLGERARRLDWFVIAIALSGIALFFIDQLTLDGLWGNILALASGLSFAAMVLLFRRNKSGSPIVSVLLGNFLATLCGLPFMIGQLPPVSSWVPLLLLGVVQLGLPYVLYTNAIKRVTALEATLLPLIEPILNPVWVMIALGERPGPWAAAGGAVVIGAVSGRALWMVRERQTISARAVAIEAAAPVIE
jgi:drug/metabolite transporter (DMT)-like permease